MPMLLGALLALAAYVAACYAALRYLLFPAAPWLVLAGAGGGVLLVAAVLIVTLLRARGLAAATVTAADAAERLPPTRTTFARDPARPHYLFAQGRDDLRAAAKNTIGTLGAMWGALGGVVAAAPPVLLGWPLLVVPLVALLAMTLTVLGFGLAAYAALGLALGVAWLGWLLAVGLLRGVDLAVRRLRGAWATCHHPGCNHRTRLPGYRCRGCPRVHRDIRAGRLGVLSRECACGQRLPTTVLRAAAELVAVCPMCDRPLRAGAAVHTDVVLPVFGPVSAGKTRLLMAGMVELRRELAGTGATLDAVGPESEAFLRQATELVGRREQTVKTDADRPPAAVTARLRHERRTVQLHLFDAAGEFFADPEQNRTLHYLDQVDGLVFVLDPFSIPAVAARLSGPFAERLAAAQPARLHPEESYLLTARRLSDHQALLRRWPLAVAVVKADLLAGLPPAADLPPDAGSGRLRDWLVEQGLDNTVAAAERDFATVRYFLVSSMEPADGRSPAAPVRWLLSRSAVELPPPGSAPR